MTKEKTRVLFVLIVIFSGTCFGQVRLPAIISDNMVLQQNSGAVIWGWAAAGEKIEISAGWQDEKREAKADKDGRWMVKIETPKAGGPYEMVIADSESSKKITNILIGEVWLGSGQSNMEFGVELTTNAKEEMANADFSEIRLFKVPRRYSDEPQADCNAQWVVCDPESVFGFSGVTYYFGREIHRKMNVPVGLIHCAWGGTWAEAWTSEEALKAESDYESILQRYKDREICEFFTPDSMGYEEALAGYNEAMVKWKEENAKAIAEGNKPPREPRKPYDPMLRNNPSGLYNGMIAPLIPFTIRGAIWYQGEWNARRGYFYRKTLPTLINNWRKDWGQGDFSFYFAQIAPYKKYEVENCAAELRESQLMTMLNVPNTGMAVTMDIGNVDDIHPRNKQEVGRRLALWAMAKDYGCKDLVYSGPIYKSMKVEGKKVMLSFDHVGSGLAAQGGELTSFVVAGEDKKFVEARAEIEGDRIVVYSKEVDKPVAVRYAWGNAIVPNLFNKEGLPASPFRTDDWPAVTADNK